MYILVRGNDHCELSSIIYTPLTQARESFFLIPISCFFSLLHSFSVSVLSLSLSLGFSLVLAQFISILAITRVDQALAPFTPTICRVRFPEPNVYQVLHIDDRDDAKSPD